MINIWRQSDQSFRSIVFWVVFAIGSVVAYRVLLDLGWLGGGSYGQAAAMATMVAVLCGTFYRVTRDCDDGLAAIGSFIGVAGALSGIVVGLLFWIAVNVEDVRSLQRIESAQRSAVEYDQQERIEQSMATEEPEALSLNN